MAKNVKLNPSSTAKKDAVDPKLPVPTKVIDVPPAISEDLSNLDKDISELTRQLEVIKQRKQDIIYGFLGAHDVQKGTPFGIPPTHDKISIFTKEELERAQAAAMVAPPVAEPVKKDDPKPE